MTRLLIITIFSVTLSAAIMIFYSPSTSMNNTPAITQSGQIIKSPKEHQRPADQTFLTYPEWFLVYSPDEFATFSEQGKTPDRFPFFGHIGQFWGAYKAVYKHIKKKYAFNTGYHVMIMVIGVSTTVEYTLRTCYEKIVGRLSYLLSSNDLTEEDAYAAKVAREYVDFIKVRPWYEFDFKRKLSGLWSLPNTGKNMFRKWERRYILTSDYAVKTIYGWIIMKATKASYDAALTVTSVVVDKPVQRDSLKTQMLQQFDDGSALMLLPRYDAFKDQVLSIARQNINVREIAGNHGDIMVTYLVPIDYQKNDTISTVLFCQPILTDPSQKRLALIVPIHNLSVMLRAYDRPGIKLEHVYDF